MPNGDRVELLRRAEELRERHASDPDAVLAEAAALAGAARRDPELRVVARHAAALAHSERMDVPAAVREARRALAAADRAGLDARAAEVRLTLAWIDLDRGRADASLAHLDVAAPLLTGRSAARAKAMRGLNLCTKGSLADAITELTAALPGLRRHGDTRWVVNTLIGRGIAYTYTDQLRAADADFARAAEHDDGERTPGAIHNRGYVALRGGDVPRSLELYDAAVAAGMDLRTRPEILVDRAEALLAAGLTDDARPVLDAAVAALDAAGRGTKLAEATLASAQCAMRQGDLDAALAGAERAARLFRGQGRPQWAPLAHALAVRVRWLAGERTPALQRAAERAAVECARHGWRAESATSTTTAARIALARGAATRARALLGGAAAARARGAADVRAAAWHAEALLRQAAGDRRGVLAACRAGLRVVDDHASLLGSAELQAHATTLASDLAGLAIGVALADRDAKAVLRWSERWRAGALARPAVRPPADSVLAEQLVALRSAVAAARDAVAAGRPDRAADRRVARLEDAVRRRALTAGAGAVSRRSPLDLAVLRAALARPTGGGHDEPARGVVGGTGARIGDATALVSLVPHDDGLHAVCVVDDRVTLHDLGDAAPLHAEVESLRFGLHRLARGTSSPRIAAATQAAVDASAATLDKALLGPVLPVVGDRPLVVVPTGPLHALPWAALPSCHGRPVTVAPSVLSWLRSVRALDAHDGSGSAWVAGPRLEHAVPEVSGLHAAAAGRLLLDAESTVDAVLDALDSCAVAHVAAHGRFRADQPLFSALELADGPLYVHDLDRLRRGPRLLVLSACDAGLSGVRPGDELMGLAAALLTRGTATLVASVVPVPDARAAAVMTALHDGLRAGLDPAAALARAQADHGQLGFVCFGASG